MATEAKLIMTKKAPQLILPPPDYTADELDVVESLVYDRRHHPAPRCLTLWKPSRIHIRRLARRNFLPCVASAPAPFHHTSWRSEAIKPNAAPIPQPPPPFPEVPLLQTRAERATSVPSATTDSPAAKPSAAINGNITTI
ncbi:hypothetical protein OROGR_025177 [Orobanche gracilis]